MVAHSSTAYKLKVVESLRKIKLLWEMSQLNKPTGHYS